MKIRTLFFCLIACCLVVIPVSAQESNVVHTVNVDKSALVDGNMVSHLDTIVDLPISAPLQKTLVPLIQELQAIERQIVVIYEALKSGADLPEDYHAISINKDATIVRFKKIEKK